MSGNYTYLMHHGIKGQEWGVQNGPPYPLDKKDRSVSEKKANNTNDQNKVDDKSLEKQYHVQIQRLDNENEYYKVTKAQITKNDAKDGPSIVNGKEINQFLKDKDYDYDMMNHISDIGCKALKIYDKDGTKSALDYLNDNLKNVNYTIRFSSEIDKEYDSEPYSTFFLVLKDNNGNGYGLSGEYDYTDDEYFLHYDMSQEDPSYLMHYGVLGQKWGVRRYQNEDGTLTSAGKKRYNNDSDQVAMKTAVKYEALADLTDKKSKAEQALGKNPWKFNNSIERKQYLESMQKAQKAFDDANSVVNDMVKKYKDVKIDILTEKETGEQYVQSILETKLGDKYISEFYLGAHVAK